MKIVLIVLGIIIVLIASSISISNVIFKRKINNEVEELFKKSKKITPEFVTEEDIEGLPEPVQRYLRYTQIIGKEKIRTVRLKQKGFIRTKEDQKWMPFDAEQYFTIDSPAFIWFATIKPAPFLSIKARDKFYEGKGNMLIKLLAFIKIADASGYEVDQSTLVRYLNEAVWFPTAYLNDYIQWEPIDSNSAKAAISYRGVTASAIFYFNEKGELTNIVAERYMDIDGQFVMETWSTPIKEYKEIKGIMIPVKGEAVWNLDSGDFSYVRLEITDIEYNNPSIYGLSSNSLLDNLFIKLILIILY